MSPTPGTVEWYGEPLVQAECVSTPKLNFARCAGSVIASQIRSGVALMKTSNTAVSPTGAVPLANETRVTLLVIGCPPTVS